MGFFFVVEKIMDTNMLPEAFLERMRQLLGAEYGEFLAALGQEPYHALRFNRLKRNIDGESAAELFSLEGGTPNDKLPYGTEPFSHLSAVPWAEDGYYYPSTDQPGKHPYHEAGLYYIQEPSAMAPAELLKVQPGDRVLDLCAAPGGKSTQIAAKLQGKGLLFCNEIHPARAKILSENIERMGICNAIVTNETPRSLAQLFPEYFDKILVDAPCSGEGMFRKNNAAWEEWSTENVQLCAQRQDEILDLAAKMLRPGGQLVYSTCTFAPVENEGSVSRFLESHRDFTLLPIGKSPFQPVSRSHICQQGDILACDGVPEWYSGITDCHDGLSERRGGLPELRNTLRLWPHRIKGEGHFAALMKKTDCSYHHFDPHPIGGIAQGISEKELAAFIAFCGESLRGQSTAKEQREQSTARAAGAIPHQKAAGAIPHQRAVGDGSMSQQLGKAVGMNGDNIFLKFGDHLYLAPACLPNLKGLKVLRPGLHLGELKKNRFEPSHALALALSPRSAVHVWNLDSSDGRTTAYLNGLTFPAEGEKGWYLICVDGFGIGWGKLAGGVMKNHYPKGLRILY